MNDRAGSGSQVAGKEDGMKAAWFYGGPKIVVGEAPDPVAGPGEVVVQVKAAGICGSDLHTYRDPERVWPGLGIPYLTGHELSGDVVAKGPGVTGLEIGQRVAVEPRHLVGCGECHYCHRGDYHLCKQLGWVGGKPTYSTGFAEYSVEPAKKVFPLADHVSYEESSILDVYACGVHALRLAPINGTKTVVVQGAGPIGLTAMECFKLGGAKKVIVCDVLDSALEFAKKIGADEVINSAKTDVVEAVKDLTDGYGPDVVIDGVGGKAPLFDLNVRMVAPGGKVVIIGMYPGNQTVDSWAAHWKEASIQWSWSYSMWDGVSEVKIALDMLTAGKLHAKEYITHTFPLDRILDGFAAADKKNESGAMKVVIKP
jgi:2-desacetyl-2-hydroxyethyl bacteriochlorophyllide A dehydrogenase